MNSGPFKTVIYKLCIYKSYIYIYLQIYIYIYIYMDAFLLYNHKMKDYKEGIKRP